MRSVTMKTILLSCVLSLAFGCSKKSGSCEDIVDHTVSLLPAEMKDKMADGKADAIAKCEKMSPEARKCAADASSLEDLMKCPHK
jgi:hypothetical protein